MARRGKFGRSGTTQNLSVLVYQLLKDQMNTELQNILTAYKTNMTAGRYSAQVNGQNIDGQYVMNYLSSMMSGFPAGSTEYETLNSQLSQFKNQYQKDIQDLVIDSMNNGTQIDFGLLGTDFSNKGIAEVELVDVQSWAAATIDDLISEGDTAQADKLKGAVFVASFNVEHDGKVASVNNESMSRGEYNKWLKGQLQAALDAGLTKDSETYRTILGLQAKAAAEAKKEGETKAAESVTAKVNSIQSDMNAKARDVLQAYANSNGIYVDEINALIGKTTSNFPYVEVLRTLAGQTSIDSEYAGFYSDVMDSIPPELLNTYNSSVLNGQAGLIQIRDGGLAGLSDADRLTVGADIARITSEGNSYISNSGMEFATGAGGASLDKLYSDLSSAGMYFRNEGTVKNGLGGHPQAVLDALKTFGTSMKDMDVQGYSLLKDLSEGNIPVNLLEGASSDAVKDINGDRVIDASEWQAALDSGVSKETIANIIEGATKKVSGVTMPSIGGSPVITAQTLVNAVIDAHVNNWTLAHGGKVVLQADGFVSITDSSAPAGPLAMPALITVGGKSYGGLSEPLQIMRTGDDNSTEDWASQTNMAINVYRTGGPGDKNSGIFVQIAGGLNGPNGAAPNGVLIPYDKFKTWMREVVGVNINDNSFMVPSADRKSRIFIESEDVMVSRGINPNDAMKDIFNPQSKYFIGKSTSGMGSGIMNINETGVTTYQFPGFIADPTVVSSSIDAAFQDKGKILAKANEYAKSRGGEVNLTDITRAVYSLIPGIPETYNMDLQADKFAQYKDVGARAQAMFPEIKSATPVKPQVWTPSGVPRDYTGAPGVPSETKPGGQIWTPSGVPQTIAPTGEKPSGKKPESPLDFIGNVFRNVPGLFSDNKAKPPAAVNPVKPTAVKPVTPTSYSTKPTTVKPTEPTRSGVVGRTDTGFTRGV